MTFFSLLGCSECFQSRDTKNPVNQKTMEELYNHTLKKVNYLKDQGFNVVQKWGCEFAKEMKEDEEIE